MPWFKVDDTAHAHPKLLRAGNAALGLWMRAGAYAAQHLTEGQIPGVVAQLYGTAAQARKLIAAGLWHPHGHTCPRCPQPPTGDYVMHDFLTYNPTREKTEQKRAAAAERQQRARERAAEQRAEQEKRSESSSKTDRFDDDSSAENLESSANQIEFPGTFAGQGGTSHRDGADPSRSPRPDPTRPPVPPTEVQQASTRGRATASDLAAVDKTPEFARPLRDRLTAAGIVVRWELHPQEWIRMHAALKRSGEDMLAAAAVKAAQRTDIGTARYLLRVWEDLPPAPAPGTAPAAAGSTVVPFRDRQQQASDDLFDRAMNRARARMATDAPAVDPLVPKELAR